MQADGPVRVGLVGCGVISTTYLQNLVRSSDVTVVALADVLQERAMTRADEFGIGSVLSLDDMLDSPDIDLVLNLTVPAVHAEISLRALDAGKHVYSEKPLAIERADGIAILRAARERNLLVGCAPDTFLGAGLQAARQVVDSGALGRPIAATAMFASHGPEIWHPDPDFFYQHGAGPLFDMGPYYLTTLMTLLGPVGQVSSLARISMPERTITSKPRYGQTIPVSTPTHVAGLLEFVSGAVVSLICSFDVYGHSLPEMEIYGTEGSLRLPDPNIFRGPVRLQRGTARKTWVEVESDSPYTGDCRGLGVEDMARAIRTGGPFRANGEMAFHVLDVMHAMYESSESGRHVTIESSMERPEPLPVQVEIPPVSEGAQ